MLLVGVVGTHRVWDSWSLRVLQGLLRGSCRAPATVLCTKGNRFAQKDSCHFSFCWALPANRWAEKGHNILYHFGHVDAFPWAGEERDAAGTAWAFRVRRIQSDFFSQARVTSGRVAWGLFPGNNLFPWSGTRQCLFQPAVGWWEQAPVTPQLQGLPKALHSSLSFLWLSTTPGCL